MLKRVLPPARRGRVTLLAHRSGVLHGNRLGDPADRDLAVYLPPGYDESPRRRYPVLFDLVGFGGSGASHVAWRAFDDNVPERIDRLIAQGKMGPVIVAFPDCFTRLGGNQYVNSPAIGRYGDYIVREMVPLVDASLRTLPGPRHRGVFGKSSGGYGAIVHGMRHPDVWGAVACHSGDMYFDFCYRCDWPRVLDEIARHGRSVRGFLRSFWGKRKNSGEEMHALMMIAMAATYDPDPRAPLGFRMPVDLRTGVMDETRWRRWLRHDPIHMAARHASALRRLRGLYIDCGTRDQYHLHYGARILSDRLRALRVPHRYEEFDDNHSGIDYRMDVSLPYLYRAIR